MQYQEYGQAAAPININTLPRISTGAAWYVAVLPLLGIVLENFASNIYVGIYLWAAVIAAAIITCVIDCRQLERLGVTDRNPKLKTFAVLPPLYLFERRKLIEGGRTIFWLGLIWLVMAIASNGFVTSATMDDDSYIGAVKSSYVYDIPEYDDVTSSYQLSEYFDTYFDEEPKYTYEQDGKTRIITVTGEANGKEISLAFTVKNDGFTNTDFKLDEVSLDGETLEGDERKNLTDEIFIETDPDSDNETESEAIPDTQSEPETVRV